MPEMPLTLTAKVGDHGRLVVLADAGPVEVMVRWHNPADQGAEGEPYVVVDVDSTDGDAMPARVYINDWPVFPTTP